MRWRSTCSRSRFLGGWGGCPVDPFEAFAEAFTALVRLPSYQTQRDRLYRIDRETARFFDAVTLQV